MNWKPDFLWCLLLTVGVIAAGCSSGSVADSTSTDLGSSPSATPDGAASAEAGAADMTLVTLDLPGMT